MNPSFLVNGAITATSVPPLDDATLEGLLTLFGAQRARALEASVRNEATENRAANAKVNQLNTALQTLGAAEPSSDTKDAPLSISLPISVVTTLSTIRFDANLVENPFARFLSFDNNINRHTVRNNGDYARLREVVRTEVDKASSDSQLNLIRMQGIINRSNQAAEFITNIVQRFSGVEDRINPNFRQ